VRKDSLAVAALATLLLLPGCAWMSKSKSSASSGLTPDQAAAILGGSADSLGNTQRSVWQRMTSPVTESTVVKSVSSGLQQGAGKLSGLAKMKPQVKPAVDPISLAQKPDMSNPDLHTSLAIMAENAGRIEQATSHLDKALAQDPQNLKALLAYGHLLDRQGRLPEAVRKYEQAIRSHPRSSQAFNDLGLCLARSGRLVESLQPLSRAVELQPNRALHRNNIATVLAELGRTDEALSHLKVVHKLPVAHYNLGTLLHRRGQTQQAAAQYAQAAALDPSFTAARQLADQLGGPVPKSIPASYTPVTTPPPTAPSGGNDGADASVVGDRYRGGVAP
jgi:tetratricopeptide (TPR) repeat protein